MHTAEPALRKPNDSYTPLFLFVFALLCRIVFYLVMKRIHPGLWDLEALHINGWLGIAERLVAGEGYSTRELLGYFPVSQLQPTASRGPVPVLVLAALLRLFKGSYVQPLLFYSWILSALTAAAIYVLARKWTLSPKAALASGVIFCLYIPEMYISTAYAAASESLFTFFLMIYVLRLQRSLETLRLRHAFVAGSVLGLAFLCRPVVLFFPLLFAAQMLARHRLKAAALVFCFVTAFAAVLAPWAIRNYAVFRAPVLTTTLGGYNLLRHNEMLRHNRFMIYTGEDFDPVARAVVAKNGQDFERLNEVQLDRLFKREAKEIIREHPVRYLMLSTCRLFWLWYRINGEKPLLLFQNLLIYLFMFPGLIRVVRGRHPLGSPALLIFYFAGFHALLNAQFRFVCPIMPYGIMIAVYEGQQLMARFRDTKTQQSF